MAQISQILSDRELYFVEPHQTVFEVATKMADLHVGAILVLKDGELCGIFSERDLLNRVLVEGRDPRLVRVAEVMTPSPTTVDESATADEAMEVMHRHNCRHLPVLRNGRVIQMISMRDLMYYDLERKAEEIQHMREYINGAAR
ncbi:MAG TPA: CBS domain-containing protein [Bryobacterales bacterium]|jgi:CBS domain-containing protein|nr:CBS domain-containing protein [Bryobacterales bacterium]